ncbi:hypothetical protein FHU13_004966 [Methylobacterium sp. R2-1]|nr:hypothetical protein [Methylobacterium sp. R2-1]MBB2964550.1 hypothetical protein [Methylobacterium sp. R2-1]
MGRRRIEDCIRRASADNERLTGNLEELRHNGDLLDGHMPGLVKVPLELAKSFTVRDMHQDDLRHVLGSQYSGASHGALRTE